MKNPEECEERSSAKLSGQAGTEVIDTKRKDRQPFEYTILKGNLVNAPENWICGDKARLASPRSNYSVP